MPKKRKRKVSFSPKCEVFQIPALSPKAGCMPGLAAAAGSAMRSYRSRRVSEKLLTSKDHKKKVAAEERHAHEVAKACSERNSAEAVMRLLWRFRGRGDPRYHETGVAAVAEDSAQAADDELADFIEELSQPWPSEESKAHLSVEDVESVLLS